MTLADYKDAKPGMFALLTGDSGVGKTTAALSFPKAYVFDFDKKMPGVALRHCAGRTDVEWDHYHTINQIVTKVGQLTRECPYETLIFDSVTQLSTMCLNAIGDAKGEDIAEIFNKVPVPGKKGGKLEAMGWDYYQGETNFIIRYFLEAIKVLYSRPGNPKHVFLLAHILSVPSAPDPTTKIITVSKSILTAGRKAGVVVPTVFDDVYHFVHVPDRKDMSGLAMKRLILTTSSGEDKAKCSFNLPSELDVTNTPFYEVVNKYLTFK